MRLSEEKYSPSGCLLGHHVGGLGESGAGQQRVSTLAVDADVRATATSTWVASVESSARLDELAGSACNWALARAGGVA